MVIATKGGHYDFGKPDIPTLTDKLIRKLANAENDSTYEKIQRIAVEKNMTIAKVLLDLLRDEMFQVIPVVSASSTAQLQELV